MRSFLNGKVVLHAGDCLEVMASLPENSVDAIVCDPPYHLTSIVKRFGGENAAACKVGKTGAYARASAGFMGKQWDGGDIAFRTETWALALRILKPGGYLIAFSGTRTYHRMTVAIEDAGFEIRDMICWHYGSGFPKSHNVSKGMDKAAGAKREKIATGAPVKRMIPGADQNADGSWIKDNGRIYQPGVEVPATADAQKWDGYGTALKPATEPICLARKPLIGRVVENVLQHGTGALNIDGCRIAVDDASYQKNCSGDRGHAENRTRDMDYAMTAGSASKIGRWPANLIHDGSPEVMALFPSDAGASAPVRGTEQSAASVGVVTGERARVPGAFHFDGGSAGRFFYTAKADAEDRLGSKHPTVKPLDLMQWLVRLVCPRGGVVLDPFAGTGSTGEAAWREGMKAVLIERETEYQADIARRMELAENPTKRAAVAKTKNKLDRPGDLPLFGGIS